MAVAGFLALASAKELAENALCGDNVSCANKCHDGRFHIVSGANGTGSYFGCSQPSTRNYLGAICSNPSQIGSHNDEATRQACDASSGKSCEQKFVQETVATCVILSDDRDTFDQACKAVDSNLALKKRGSLNGGDVSVEQASKDAACEGA
ncbi:hypothetical protein Q7P37_008122 [Cladosporium fusiforme]